MSALVWHMALILDAVILPAWYLDHNLELLWSRVAFCIESADFAVISIETNLHSVNKYILYLSVCLMVVGIPCLVIEARTHLNT